MPTWIRVRDTSTGHEFDLSPQALAAATGVERVEGYPELSGPGARPRPAKPHVNKGGKPAARKSTAPAARDAGQESKGAAS